MAGFSDYAENKVLDHIVGKTSFTLPTAYVALFSAAPTDAGGGTELSGSGYARVTTAGSDWDAAAAGAIANAAILTFPTATANWAQATHFGIYDAATVGNLLGWAALTTAKTVLDTETARFPVGALDLALD